MYFNEKAPSLIEAFGLSNESAQDLASFLAKEFATKKPQRILKEVIEDEKMDKVKRTIYILLIGIRLGDSKQTNERLHGKQ